LERARAIELDVFRRFVCQVWVQTLSKPIVHRAKFAPHARPGQFLESLENHKWGLGCVELCWKKDMSFVQVT
jgi:hypothetical protein